MKRIIFMDFKQTLKKVGEIGYIEEVISSIVYINGLPNAKASELILFETGDIGQVLSLGKTHIEVIVLGSNILRVGTAATRTNEILLLTVGKELLGMMIDPLGTVISGDKDVSKMTKRLPVNITPPGIVNRRKITRSFETGVSLVDMAIPLGRGQRELVIGDRKTGKSIFLQQTILTQARNGSICIYAAIGKKMHDVKVVEEFFKSNKVTDNVVMVTSSSEDPLSIIYLTPYTAMTIAEYFCQEGNDVLLIMDDLTTHAKFYREIALLGKRFPGRNSYPGDIFYTHARLLERAGNFVTKTGENSITCLPVVETVSGDLSGYIQTNLMSITDGHIYFDKDLFAKGRRPAINPFLSVTRVGHSTESTLRRSIDREIMSFLTLFEKIQTFVHFGTELGSTLKVTLVTGENIYRFFDQALDSVIPMNVQIILFTLLWKDLWKQASVDAMRKDMDAVMHAYETDTHMRKTINDMVTNSKNFNDLITLVAKNGKIFLDLMPEKPAQTTAAPIAQTAPQPTMPTAQPTQSEIRDKR